MKDLDIVYFVKEGENDELRFSLRSVAKNFPHRKVWIYGSKPESIIPDEYVPVSQQGTTKWDRVRYTFRLMALNEDITEDFVLFNDDFFVMKPVEELGLYYRCPIYEHIVTLEEAYGDKPTPYSLQLRKTVSAIHNIRPNMVVNSYELHIPMVMNRHKLLEVMGAFPNNHCTRTLYANYYGLEGAQMNDVKVYDENGTFDEDSVFLSTQDESFRRGDVGRYIMSKFQEKCKYEQ